MTRCGGWEGGHGARPCNMACRQDRFGAKCVCRQCPGGKCEHIGSISGAYRAFIGRIWGITLDIGDPTPRGV